MSPLPSSNDRIDICNEGHVAYWTECLGISEEQLRRTIAEVGDAVDAVCERHPQGVALNAAMA